jgi:hypothetical protein
MRFFRSIVVAGLAFVTACATKGSSPATENAPRRDRSVITQEEIDAARATDAYAVVRALRPGWLLGKTVGTGRVFVQVYVEGNKAGNTTVLQQYNPAQVKELRFFNSEEATTRFGTGNQAGAILLTLRR